MSEGKPAKKTFAESIQPERGLRVSFFANFREEETIVSKSRIRHPGLNHTIARNLSAPKIGRDNSWVKGPPILRTQSRLDPTQGLLKVSKTPVDTTPQATPEHRQ